VNAFNEANPDSPLASSSFQNDAFESTIRTAIGADQAPTIIWT
jgi:raffinose/stachyose/melibiose transport system substrate-binding protein